jgi:uncharacterized protein
MDEICSFISKTKKPAAKNDAAYKKKAVLCKLPADTLSFTHNQSIMVTALQAIDATKKWIADVVIGCNFCPFAAKVVKQQTVHYGVQDSADRAACLTAFMLEAARLDDDSSIETIFLIFPNSYQRLDDYLDLVSLAEKLLKKNGYEGIYQVASFHPLYLFANTTDNDAANYTNRSVYPMLHLLRESSIDAALEHYKDPEAIPGRNIDFARNKGLVYMQMLRESCF